MEIDVLYYTGGRRANKALVDAIIACVLRNAPRAKVEIEARTEFAPSRFAE
jgi:hypothetical protein